MIQINSFKIFTLLFKLYLFSHSAQIFLLCIIHLVSAVFLYYQFVSGWIITIPSSIRIIHHRKDHKDQMTNSPLLYIAKFYHLGHAKLSGVTIMLSASSRRINLNFYCHWAIVCDNKCSILMTLFDVQPWNLMSRCPKIIRSSQCCSW